MIAINNEKIRFYLLFSLILMLCSCDNTGDNFRIIQSSENFMIDKQVCMNMPRPADSYNYPVYPGMLIWSSISTREEMNAVCQVPLSVLKSQSTQAVLQAIWEYPFLPEILEHASSYSTRNYDYYESVIDSVFGKNNAYQELLKRKDVGKCLIERYAAVNPIVAGAVFEPRALEVLIFQFEFMSQLKAPELKKLVQLAFDKLTTRLDTSNFEDSMTDITWLLVARAMRFAEYDSFVIKSHTEPDLIAYFESSFDGDSAQYISLLDKIIGAGIQFKDQ